MAFRDRTSGIEGAPAAAAVPDPIRQRALSARAVRSVATGPAGATQLMRRAELALAWQGRPVPRRLVRVPLGAVVPPGSALSIAPQPARLASPVPRRRNGADTQQPIPSPAPRGKAAYILREAVTVVLFLATLAAMYHLGRAHAFQNVIIVPEPWSRQSTLG